MGRAHVNGQSVRIDKTDKPAIVWRRGRVGIFQAWPEGIAQVAATLRPKDQAEIFGLWDNEDRELLVRLAMISTLRYVAVGPSGEAGIAFGAAQQWPKNWSVWMFGGRRFDECARVVARYCRRFLPRSLLSAGVHRAECRARFGVENNFEFIEGMGARGYVPLPAYGKDGADYRLYYWLFDDIQALADGRA